jgi:hypothetical protein
MFRTFSTGTEKGADFNPRCLTARCWISLVYHERLPVGSVAHQEPDIAIGTSIKLSAVCHFEAFARLFLAFARSLLARPRRSIAMPFSGLGLPIAASFR